MIHAVIEIVVRLLLSEDLAIRPDRIIEIIIRPSGISLTYGNRFHMNMEILP